jgi:hypothetical protein
MAEHTEADLEAAISSRTREHWDEKHEPLLLSQLGPALLASGLKFKELVAIPMKKFIEEKLRGVVTIVSHPDQRQKIGVIPHGENYDFPPLKSKAPRKVDRDLTLIYDLINEPSENSVAVGQISASAASSPTKNERTAAAIHSLTSRDGSSRKFIYQPNGASEEKIKAFLRLIDGLTLREIDTISIPLRTFVRMLMS